MIELLIVTKSKDPNGNNYSFSVQMDANRDDIEKAIFSVPQFPLRWDTGVAYIATSDISICRINEATESTNQVLSGPRDMEIVS